MTVVAVREGIYNNILREIGEVLEVSESRVCQIHGQALVRLRARLAEWLTPD